MKECPYCKELLADNAIRCTCGYDFSYNQEDHVLAPKAVEKKDDKKKANVNAIYVTIAIVIGAFVIGSFMSNNSNSSSSSKKSEVVEISAWDASVYQVKDYLKKNLKDPSSVEYIEWSKVVKAADSYSVRVKYRAKNSFGAFVIENQLFKLDLSGNVISFTNFEQ